MMIVEKASLISATIRFYLKTLKTFLLVFHFPQRFGVTPKLGLGHPSMTCHVENHWSTREWLKWREKYTHENFLRQTYYAQNKITTPISWARIIKLVKNNVVSSAVTGKSLKLKSFLTNTVAHYQTWLSNTPSIQISIKHVQQTRLLENNLTNNLIVYRAIWKFTIACW